MEQEQSSVEKFEKFTWKIENFSRLKTDDVYSEPFVIGGYPWYDDLISMNDEFQHVRIYWICLSYIFVFLSALVLGNFICTQGGKEMTTTST
jgi:hypothetical protein